MTDPIAAPERQPLAGATIDDLSLNLVREHLQVTIERREYSGPTDPIEYLIQHAAVVEGPEGALLPTLVGILAFAREPDRWITASGIDVAQFSGSQPNSSDLIFSKQMRGNLDTLIERTVELLWARSEHRYRLEGTERIEEHAYPLVVLRELTVNAIAHRDWSQIGSRVRIQMFPDRIEWLSPGSLPPGVTVETLREEQVNRNPALAQILYQSGKVESFGMGIDTVEDTLRAWGSRPLYVNDNGRRVLFSVYGRILAAPREAPQRAALTDRATTILALIDQRGPMSISDLGEALQVSRRTLQYDLRKLVDSGVLVVTGATNNRRYQRREGGVTTEGE
jgi:ATP-dependent DNA helicase RecG